MINLPEDNPDAVTAMVRFIYLNEYTSNFYHDEQCKLRCEFAYPCASCISFLAHLYGLGEKYGITGLKDASGSSLGLALRLYPQKISFIAFQEAGKIIYSTTPDGDRMRSTIADAIIQRSDLLTKSTFQQLMQTTPELARDVTLTLAKAKDEASRMLVEANSDRKDLKRQLNDSREQFRKRFRRNGTSDH